MDSALQIPIISWYDYKTSKEKPVPILPGQHAEVDVSLAYADAAMSGQFNLRGATIERFGKNIFPQFLEIEDVSPKVTAFLQALVPGATGSYSHVTVPGLDPKSSNHSLKHGACDDMEANGVAPGNVTDLTGHSVGSNPRDGGGGSSSAYASSYHKASNSRVVVGKL